MSKGYWILHLDVADMDAFKDYAAAASVALKEYNPTFLVGGGVFEIVDGELKSRHAVLEFASYQAALDCYHSDKYQEAVRLREACSTCDLVIVEGK